MIQTSTIAETKKEELYIFLDNIYNRLTNNLEKIDDKKFNEDLATVYKNFYKINLAGLRFFTVYGEWGRPDMFYYKVIDSAFKKKSLYLNNFGNHSRDFTYIRDVNIILFNLLRKKTKFKNEIFNICSNKPFQILKIVKLVEKYTNKISLKKENSKSRCFKNAW